MLRELRNRIKPQNTTEMIFTDPSDLLTYLIRRYNKPHQIQTIHILWLTLPLTQEAFSAMHHTLSNEVGTTLILNLNLLKRSMLPLQERAPFIPIYSPGGRMPPMQSIYFKSTIENAQKEVDNARNNIHFLSDGTYEVSQETIDNLVLSLLNTFPSQGLPTYLNTSNGPSPLAVEVKRVLNLKNQTVR